MIKSGKLIIILTAILIAGALVYSFLPKPLEVTTVTVSRGPFQVILEEEGKTRLKERFKISAPVTGTLCRIGLEVGDFVSAGEKLCEITPLKSVLLDPRSKADARDRVAAAEAALRTVQAKAEADMASAEYALSEYTRLKKIYAKNLISLSALERAKKDNTLASANLRSSRSAVDTARYQLEEARNALAHFPDGGHVTDTDHFEIHSPITGQVLAVYKESEGSVTTGQILMEVGDPHDLEVMVEARSADAVRMAPGIPVLFERWGGEQPLNGLVRLIEPSGFTKISALGVEEQRVRIIIDIASPSDQWERLGDSYRVNAKFILWQEENVLQIPDNALFRYNDSWAVFIANSNKEAELRQVKPGKRSGLRAQILSGLEEGELIITHPDERIQQGRRLQLSDTKQETVNGRE
ncbi:MAG: HlyD family efflux transporter periplasmic adaptor subunit [Gammaproteobacteria bacterium]